MKKSGVTFKLGTLVQEVRREGDETVTVLNDGTELRADLTLVALGITPNTSELGLEQLGIRLSRGFIEIDESCSTNIPGVYAVGDVTTKGGLAHTATAQGHMCAERIAGHHAPAVDYDSIPGCTYCQPQVASVGLTEEQARAKGLRFTIGRFPFVANGKAQGAGAAEGFVKVLVGEQYGEILGAHIVGAAATEMIAEFTLARTSESTADVVMNTVHAHPTYSEAMFEAVAQARGASVHI
jgi:dihydrolipoamide dehydrogenase